jgi:eight-cysteine-cluster-containing protein
MSDEDCEDGQICELIDLPCYDDCDPDDEYCAGDCAPYGLCLDVPEPTDQCKPTGCSGQICSAMDINTTCEWLPFYACFHDANCGPYGLDGACAWEHTEELSACLGLSF